MEGVIPACANNYRYGSVKPVYYSLGTFELIDFNAYKQKPLWLPDCDNV